MPKIVITAETGCDIPAAEAAELGVTLVPMHVTIGDKTIDDGELSSAEMLEPPEEAPALTNPAQLVGSVCLVPGLVFDGAGHRIGYGGGFYDRFLAFYPGEKIGLARTTMLSSNPLPTDGHDVPVDFIATEGSVWSCRSY